MGGVFQVCEKPMMCEKALRHGRQQLCLAAPRSPAIVHEKSAWLQKNSNKITLNVHNGFLDWWDGIAAPNQSGGTVLCSLARCGL